MRSEEEVAQAGVIALLELEARFPREPGVPRGSSELTADFMLGFAHALHWVLEMDREEDRARGLPN